jgi:beta-N-acetylhexosaminidase
MHASLRRVRRLRRWLGDFEPPDRGVVRSQAHRELARRAAGAAVTLVRDDGGLLPLRPAAAERIVVITPQPRDLTPADSSSDEPLALAEAVRRYRDEVTHVRVSADPSAAEIAAARDAAAGARVAIVATLAADAQPGQARLVEAILSSGTPTVTLAMRTPYDLAAYPRAGTHLCSYAIVPASVGAVADVLFGRVPVRGRLPVPIPGLYPRGHGRKVETWG